jgi:hypothetical protein
MIPIQTVTIAPTLGDPTMGVTILTAATDQLEQDYFGVDQSGVQHFTREYNPLQLATNGAAGTNFLYQQGQYPQMYIEEQRPAGEILYALVNSGPQPAISSIVANMVNWGFEQQAADGSFPTSGDPFHSDSLFLSTLAMGMLPFKMGPNTNLITPWIRPLLLGLTYLGAPSSTAISTPRDENYSHRRGIYAHQFIAGAKIGNRPDLYALSASFIDNFIAQATPAGTLLAIQPNDSSGSQVSGIIVFPGHSVPPGTLYTIPIAGIFPENDDYAYTGTPPQTRGFDLSYMLVGFRFMAAAVLSMESTDLVRKNALITALEIGANIALTFINPDGSPNMAGSCRAGIGTARAGNIKAFDSLSAIQAWMLLYYATGNITYYNTAVLMAENLKTLIPGFDYTSAAIAHRAV